MQQGIISNTPHNDWMFYVLYHHDSAFLQQIIAFATKNLCETFNIVPDCSSVLEWFSSTQSDSIHTLRAKLLLLLDRDEKTRKEFTVFRSNTCRLRPPLPLAKADRFYAELHDRVIPQWVCNENISLNEFVDNARMAYLIS